MAVQEAGASIDKAILALDADAAKTLEALKAELADKDRDIEGCVFCETRP